MDGVRVKNEGAGGPRKRPKVLIADSAYDAKRIRRYLRRRGIRANVARNKRNQKRVKPGRPTHFDEDGYSVARSSAERFFSWLKCGFRRLAIRYERIPSVFLALIHIACIVIYWR